MKRLTFLIVTALAAVLISATPFAQDDGAPDPNMVEIAREITEVAQNEYPKTAKGKEGAAEWKEIAAECGFDADTSDPQGLGAECQEEVDSWKAETSAEITALHASTRHPETGPDGWTIAGVVVGVIGIVVTIIVVPK